MSDTKTPEATDTDWLGIEMAYLPGEEEPCAAVSGPGGTPSPPG
jgi:hypothetical protein